MTQADRMDVAGYLGKVWAQFEGGFAIERIYHPAQFVRERGML